MTCLEHHYSTTNVKIVECPWCAWARLEAIFGTPDESTNERRINA